ncbi:MAG: MFS transporter [Candidatus Muiribacteriota bacterium]
MNYIQYYLKNKNVLTTGFILNFFSSYGQTFFISLYVPHIIKDLGIASGISGFLYGAATILSSITIIFVGKYIDTIDIRIYTVLTAILAVGSGLFLSFSFNIYIFFLGLWGLRLAGQGLMSHISLTAISKIYNETRGRALSIVSLGYPVGEALLPTIVGFKISNFGWRNSMLINSITIFCVLIPVILFFMKNPTFKKINNISRFDSRKNKFSRSFLLKDSKFYILAANYCVLPMIITGLFFYQVILAEEKGWGIEVITTAFIFFALSRVIFSLYSGKLIDKFKAVNVFPFHLLPFAIGLFVIGFIDHQIAAYLYLFFSGITMGLSNIVKSALIAEIYGTEFLGSIRAVFATTMVLSTALGPVIFGFMMDSGFSLIVITRFTIPFVLIVALSSTFLNLDK